MSRVLFLGLTMAFFRCCQIIILPYVMLKTESICHDEKAGPSFGKRAHDHLTIFRLFAPSLLPIMVDKLHHRLVGYVLETFFSYRPHVLNVSIFLQYRTLCGAGPAK